MITRIRTRGQHRWRRPCPDNDEQHLLRRFNRGRRRGAFGTDCTENGGVYANDSNNDYYGNDTADSTDYGSDAVNEDPDFSAPSGPQYASDLTVQNSDLTEADPPLGATDAQAGGGGAGGDSAGDDSYVDPLPPSPAEAQPDQRLRDVLNALLKLDPTGNEPLPATLPGSPADVPDDSAAARAEYAPDKGAADADGWYDVANSLIYPEPYPNGAQYAGNDWARKWNRGPNGQTSEAKYSKCCNIVRNAPARQITDSDTQFTATCVVQAAPRTSCTPTRQGSSTTRSTRERGAMARLCTTLATAGTDSF